MKHQTEPRMIAALGAAVEDMPEESHLLEMGQLDDIYQTMIEATVTHRYPWLFDSIDTRDYVPLSALGTHWELSMFNIDPFAEEPPLPPEMTPAGRIDFFIDGPVAKYEQHGLMITNMGRRRHD